MRFVHLPPSPEEEAFSRAARPSLRYAPGDIRADGHLRVGPIVPRHPCSAIPLPEPRHWRICRHFPFPDAAVPIMWMGLRSRSMPCMRVASPPVGICPSWRRAFQAAWRLRGLEAFLLDLLERSDWARLSAGQN